MKSVADGRVNDASVAVIVGPARLRFRTIISWGNLRYGGSDITRFIYPRQAVHILRFEDEVLRVLVVLHIMLLILNPEFANSFRDGVLVFCGPHAKRADWRMAAMGSPHHVAERLVHKANNVGIVIRMEPVPGFHKVLDRHTLFVR